MQIHRAPTEKLTGLPVLGGTIGHIAAKHPKQLQ